MSVEVYSQLHRWILSGELMPGERLQDQRLAERFGVSAATVRQALDRLTRRGLVEVVPHRFTRVATLETARIRGIVDLVADVWVGALRRAAFTDPDGISLIETFAELAAAAQKRDPSDFGMALFELATRGFPSGRDDVRGDLIEELGAHVRRYWLVSGEELDWSAVDAFVADVSTAIRQGDSEQAQAAIAAFFDEVPSSRVS